MRRRLRQLNATFLTILLVGTVAVVPLAARAVPVEVVLDAPATTIDLGTRIETILKNAALIGIRNTLNAFLGKVAYDAAVWIASAGTGQQSLVYSEPYGQYLKNAGKAATGGLIDGFAEAAGLDAANLCDPGEEFRLGLTIGLDVQAKQPYKPSCTLSELKGNWKEAYSDPKFKDYLELQFDSTANPLGITLEAENLTLVLRGDAEKAAELERQASEIGPVADPISKNIKTPGSYTFQKLGVQDQATQDAIYQMVGNPAVDALSIFGTTLISKLLQRAQEGIANLKSGSELSDIISGEASGVSTGRAAAEEVFAELRQPTFAASGVFDILAELSSCPEDEDLQGINNCAIGPTMQLAITEGWTIQEFVDYQTDVGGQYSFAYDELAGTEILGDNGITPRGITLLKKYRIAPVGWQVAADYISEVESETARITLAELVSCFAACGSSADVGTCSKLLVDETGDSTNYSPYCRLVDPSWVLKAPQNFCEKEAPGPDFASLEDIDDDANVNTQSAVIASRLNYCADNRGCIQEEQAGVCTAYGYCTEEERIYRFAGQVCSEEYASCQNFTDEDGNDFSYVKSSLNYNDCATDPGCQWYCTSTNAVGQFDCASPTETYITCSEDVATNESDYGLTYDIQYNANQACACEATQTCIVPAGSEAGDNDGDGLIDFRECTVNNSDGSESVCTLPDNCGASNSTYNSAAGQCTCTINNSCSVEASATSCSITVQTVDGGSGTQTCTLDDGNSCTENYSTYSSAPICEVAGPGLLNCGDTCTTTVGGSCTNNLGNTCVDGSSSDADGTANGNCTLEDQCAIGSGQYSCTSTSGNVCILGTLTEDPQIVNDTLYFDNNVEACQSSEAGCTQYIRIQSDTNLIPNALFDYYDEERNTVNDSNDDGSLDPIVDGDDLAFCTHDGEGCASDSNCDENSDGQPEGQCIGWIQNDVTAYVLAGDFNVSVTPDVGTNYVQIPVDGGSGAGTFEMTVDTGQSVENRTFTFSYRATSGAGTCEDVSFTIGTGDGAQVSEPVTAAADGTDYDYTADWQDYTVTYTFPDESDPGATYSPTTQFGTGGPGTTIKVAISESASCDINIGATELTESNEFDDEYTNYGAANVTYLNDALSCSPDDVGCELYVAKGQDESDGIPGIITNPDSDACLDDDGKYDYAKPECNQCNGNPAADQGDDYYAGCSFYQAVPLESAAPLTEVPSWLATGSDEYEGVIQRLGGYCEVDSTTHCYVDSDCSSGACIDSVSIVPSSGEQCSAADVGCEEYTNLAAVEAGGEGLAYYTQLQQCVRTDDQETAVYYTFEGSDTGGVQIEDHTLKVNTATGAPCTHLDPQSEEFNADCIDATYSTTEQNTWDCGPDGDIDGDSSVNSADPTTDAQEYGTDADCRQYLDDAGTIFYRYASDVIQASDACTPLRNSLDTRVYFAIPESSNDCSAAVVGCREYKGTNSGSAETIIDEDFSSNSTDDWLGAESTSNESVLQAGYSLQLHDADTANTNNSSIAHTLFTKEDTNGDGQADVTGLLEPGTAYILTFWAKVSDGGTLTSAFEFDTSTSDSNYYFTTSGSSTVPASMTLDPNGEGGWQYYIVGPVVLPASESVDEGDEYFVLKFTGAAASSQAYIDTILLTQSNSQYLIQDSARTCNGFEGCREYRDRDRVTHYLKSFQRLCEDSVVGCEALLATQNSQHPFTEAYNMDNEYDQDDVIVPYDQPVTLVYDEANECSANFKGCTEVGLAEVDDRTGQLTGYDSVFLLNTPDDYTSTLCEQPQLSCREFSSNFDGTVYFKDPGERVCELREYTEDGNTYNGWFKFESAATIPDCPLQQDFSDVGEVYASQPLGGVCNSNSIKVQDGACTTAAGASLTYVNETDCAANSGIWNDDLVDDRVGKLCNQDADCYPSGWQSGDPRPRCISTLDDDIDVNDGGVHQYITTQDDNVTLRSRVQDFGWVGLCSAEESGCSEYVDPYSPNLEELNRNWSFEDDVRDDINAYYKAGATPTGFPDWWIIPYNTGDGIDIDRDGTTDISSADCTTSAVQITNLGTDQAQTDYSGDSDTGEVTGAADGASAVVLNGQCIIENLSAGSYYAIQPDQTYNIQAQVAMDESSLDTGSNTPAEFSIGVHYYTSDGPDDDESLDAVIVDDQVLYPVADHATIAYEDNPAGDLSYWYRWQGSIGVGTTLPIPTYGTCNNSSATTKYQCELYGGRWTQKTIFARVFVVNHSDDPIYFDAVSFKETDKYYYLDYTVDGTAEHEQQTGTNSCVDQDTNASAITSDGGCVAFRDATSDAQNYSQDGLDCTTCLQTPNSDSCRYLVDACDTNAVLKVKKDRVCSEWLACETARLVEDEQGDSSTMCFSLSRCNKLDEDGNCSGWITAPQYDQITSATDLHFTSAAGDADTLQSLRNLTGYSKVGVTWNNVLTCVGGPQNGSYCITDENCVNPDVTCESGQCSNDSTISCNDPYDCYDDNDAGSCSNAFDTEGYYPYGWMPEVGTYGAQTGEDLIEQRDFENLFCSGGKGDSSVPCVLNANDTNAGHCFTNALQQELLTNPDDDLIEYSDVVFVDSDGFTTDDEFDSIDDTKFAYCPNSPGFGSDWPFGREAAVDRNRDEGWTGLGGSSSTVFVTQHERYKDCPAPCADIDLNNVLQVGPTLNDDGEAFTGGVQNALKDKIDQGGSYALSFDARYVTDPAGADEGGIPSTISICLDHNNIEDSSGAAIDRKDCFVNGFGEADIIFIVDTSGSMAGVIDAVTLAIPDLAASLAASGIDAQFAVVDMEQAVDTLELALTSDLSAIDNAMTKLVAADASVDPWRALTEAINDSYLFTGFIGPPRLGYRSEAQPILVLVTDTHDEQTGEGDTFTEASVTDLLGQVDSFPIIAVTDDNTADYYNAIARISGGGVSNDIADPDWTSGSDSVNSAILEIVIDNVDIFQFSNTMETYTLGPITVEEKFVNTDAGESVNGSIFTDLEFLGSDSVSFQIDNVSMFPVLEVNKALDPIARSCRAYPETDALQCIYSEPTGTQFVGWKGYCLETDPTNTSKCLIWWPLDVLEGEESIVQREVAGYTGRTAVNHCLVSRGLAHAGFCDELTYNSSTEITNTYGNGVLCGFNTQACSDFSGKGCMYNPTYTLLDTNDDTIDDLVDEAEDVVDEAEDVVNSIEEHDLTSNSTTDYSEVISTGSNEQSGPAYEVNTMFWDMFDPWESANPCVGGIDADLENNEDNCYEVGLITRLPANEILRNIHISEMETIEFYPGSAGDGGGGGPEYYYWGQLNGQQNPTPGLYDPSGASSRNIGNVWLTDLKQGGLEFTEAGNPVDKDNFPNCYPFRDVNEVGFGCRYWGLWDSNMVWDDYESKNLPDFSPTGHGYDLVYTFVWANFDWGAEDNDEPCNKDGDAITDFETLSDPENFEEWFDSECVDNALDAVAGDTPDDERNPWEHINPEAFDDIYLNTVTREEDATILIDNTDVDDWEGWGDPNDGENTNDNHQGGGNLMSVYLDFNVQGYIQAVYVLLWVGAQDTQDTSVTADTTGIDIYAGVETTFAEPMHLDIQVRESCLLISESVDANNANYAWAQRIDGAGGYLMNRDTDDEYGHDTATKPYGSITPAEDTPDTISWDSIVDFDFSETDTNKIPISPFSTLGKQPVFSYVTEELNAGHPLTCIGDCSVKACVGHPKKVGEECVTDNDCNDDGVQGRCMGVGDATISEGSVGEAFSSAGDQLQAAAIDAVNRLKYVVAGIASDRFYRADFSNPDLYFYDGVDYWKEDNGGPNAFDSMIQCRGEDGQRPLNVEGQQEEYCGVLPKVTGIKINGETGSTNNLYSIANGQTIEFEFSGAVEGEQEPLEKIYIDWGDGTTPVNDKWGAQDATFTYTHAYTCGADNDDRFFEEYCDFTPTIVIVDHWDWCSGLKSGFCSSSNFGTEQACNDAKQNDPTITWTNGGDHRYTADSGSANLMANCQSYDNSPLIIRVDATS